MTPANVHKQWVLTSDIGRSYPYWYFFQEEANGPIYYVQRNGRVDMCRITQEDIETKLVPDKIFTELPIGVGGNLNVQRDQLSTAYKLNPTPSQPTIKLSDGERT